MAVSDELSFAEIGARWPDALVLWDRDVAGQGWTPLFRGSDPRHPPARLCAFDRACVHARGNHDGDAVEWSMCRCVIWTGDAWITLAAERYDAVRRALRGEHFELERHASMMLWYMLARSSSAEITPSRFIVPNVSGRSNEYNLSFAPAIVSFLLDGVGLPASGHAIRPIRLRDRKIHSRLPLWDEGVPRYVRFDDADSRTMIRIAGSEAELSGPSPPG